MDEVQEESIEYMIYSKGLLFKMYLLYRYIQN
jgi:hypothetical protein